MRLPAILITVIVLSSNAFAFDFYIQGIDIKWFKQRNYFAIALGGITGFIVHEACHYATAKTQGQSVDWSWYGGGPYMIWSNGHGENAYLWTARSGFIGELAIGLMLNIIPRTSGSDFTIGYSTIGTARLALYNIASGGDFDSIREEGGRDKLEWFILTGTSTGLSIKSIIDSKKEE